MKHLKLMTIAFFATMLFIGCSSSTEPNINNPESIPNPEGFYEFDIKTHFADKSEIKGAKAGLKGLINESSWGTVGNFGEDYAVWIGDITKTAKSGNKFDVEFTIFLSDPSFMGQGATIKEKSFEISYDVDDFEYDEEGNLTAKAMQYIVNGLGTDVAANCGIPMAGLGISILSKLIANDESSIKNRQQMAESIIIGGMCFGQLKLWINEIEAGK